MANTKAGAYRLSKGVWQMELKNRMANRLPNYDYGEIGCYFVTLCTHHRQPLFCMEKSTASGSKHIPNQIIRKWLIETQNKFQNITISQYVIMQDHVHLIVGINEQCPGGSVPEAMRFFKTMTTNDYIRGVKKGVLPSFDTKLWQKSYYDHVIRNQKDYDEIWQYIENNPEKWMLVHKNNNR